MPLGGSGPTMAAPMFRDLPPEPQVPENQRGEGAFSLRYEDVTQDGRMRLEPLSHAIGASVWRSVLATHPLAQRLTSDGILPILSRLSIESDEGPVDVRSAAQCVGAMEMIRCVGEDGRVRLRMDTWAEARATRGRTHGPVPDGAGQPIALGRVLAEHVLTRPFAASPEERSVTELPGGWPEDVPRRDAHYAPPRAALVLPKGAEPIDDAFALDPCPITLGIGHTDSNQHVNSLVYPRLLEEAALRRFHALGESTARFARFVDLGFRKPCFAGDRMRIMLRAFRLGDELGVLGAFITAGEAIGVGPTPSERAHAFARMQFVA